MNEIKLLQGDCLDKLKELKDNSIDSVVTDPPYKVYELVNDNNDVEYVGQTKNPKARLRGHKCINGDFHNRNDISMKIVKGFNTRKEAINYEKELQIKNGLEPKEYNARVSNGKKLGDKFGKLNASTLSKAGKKYGETKLAKPVRVFNNTFSAVYPSLREATRQLDLHWGNSNAVVNGKRNHHKGYKIVWV